MDRILSTVLTVKETQKTRADVIKDLATDEDESIDIAELLKENEIEQKDTRRND